MTNSDKLVATIIGRIGIDFDGECHLTEAEARQAADTILTLKAENDALREVMRETAQQLREFWAQDSGTSVHLVAADNLARAALSGSPEG